MVNRSELSNYLGELLDVDQVNDYCPNGLQIEGASNIELIVTGVTASQDLIDRAIELGADAIIVHHGYFWKGESQPIVGMKQKRIASILLNGINLYAYHLPLDIHAEFGNNTQLGNLLNFTIVKPPVALKNFPGLIGELARPVTGKELASTLENSLRFKPVHIDTGRLIKRVAWCTGAAQDYIDMLAGHNIDAYVSGEISERTVHSAREQNIHYFSAGHHATERFGIQALGNHLKNKFQLSVEFIDLPIPV